MVGGQQCVRCRTSWEPVTSANPGTGVSSQIQAIETDLLPMQVSGLPLAKKADLAFAFTPAHEEMTQIYENSLRGTQA